MKEKLRSLYISANIVFTKRDKKKERATRYELGYTKKNVHKILARKSKRNRTKFEDNI
jgi:hypothetical protein